MAPRTLNHPKVSVLFGGGCCLTWSFGDTSFFHLVALVYPRILSSSLLSLHQLIGRGRDRVEVLTQGPEAQKWHFFLYSVHENLVTWPYPAAREAGKHNLAGQLCA